MGRSRGHTAGEAAARARLQTGQSLKVWSMRSLKLAQQCRTPASQREEGTIQLIIAVSTPDNCHFEDQRC